MFVPKVVDCEVCLFRVVDIRTIFFLFVLFFVAFCWFPSSLSPKLQRPRSISQPQKRTSQGAIRTSHARGIVAIVIVVVVTFCMSQQQMTVWPKFFPGLFRNLYRVRLCADSLTNPVSSWRSRVQTSQFGPSSSASATKKASSGSCARIATLLLVCVYDVELVWWV